MPSARELLEEVDALMRRNRAAADEGVASVPQGKDAAALTEAIDAAEEAMGAGLQRDHAKPQPAGIDAFAEEIPILTEVADVPREGAAMAGEALPASSSSEFAEQDDVPVLTDAVEEIDAPSIAGVPEAAAESPAARDVEEVIPSVEAVPAEPEQIPATAPAETEQTAATAPGIAPMNAQDSGTPTRAWDATHPAPESLEELAVMAAAASEPTTDASRDQSGAPPATMSLHGDAARWEALAEEIRMQVLQRIDIFTDTGLQMELRQRVQPIVDRASADLVTTINREVGQLLRAYVAEAIEREIEKWRDASH